MLRHGVLRVCVSFCVLVFARANLLSLAYLPIIMLCHYIDIILETACLYLTIE